MNFKFEHLLAGEIVRRIELSDRLECYDHTENTKSVPIRPRKWHNMISPKPEQHIRNDLYVRGNYNSNASATRMLAETLDLNLFPASVRQSPRSTSLRYDYLHPTSPAVLEQVYVYLDKVVK